MLISPSALYRQAARLTPEGRTVVTSDSYCVMCAAELPAGALANLVTKATFDKAFNNKWDLRAASIGRYVCGDCQVLWTKDWLQKYSKTVATTNHVYKFASNDQMAAILLNPPEPPFVMIFSTKQQQHMIWRTSVSYSREFYVVRVDSEQLTIRQPRLLAAYRAFKHAEELMGTTAIARTGRKLKPPAALFSRELAIRDMGLLRTDVVELMQQEGATWVIDAMADLSMGEWWALNVIRHYDPENPPPYQLAIEP